MGDAEAGEEADNRQPDQNHARPLLLALKIFAQKSTGEGAEDDGDKGAKFQNAVAPGKFLLREQLRQQPVLGGAKDRAVNPHEKQGSQNECHHVAAERERSKNHHEDFKYLYGHRDIALAVMVREITTHHGKDDKRQREQRADDAHHQLTSARWQIHAYDHENDQILQRIVAERSLKLRDDEGPKAFAGRFSCDILCFGSIHRE